VITDLQVEAARGTVGNPVPDLAQTDDAQTLEARPLVRAALTVSPALRTASARLAYFFPSRTV
jgi:hypothetical protein